MKIDMCLAGMLVVILALLAFVNVDIAIVAISILMLFSIGYYFRWLIEKIFYLNYKIAVMRKEFSILTEREKTVATKAGIPIEKYLQAKKDHWDYLIKNYYYSFSGIVMFLSMYKCYIEYGKDDFVDFFVSNTWFGRRTAVAYLKTKQIENTTDILIAVEESNNKEKEKEEGKKE